MWTEKVFCKFSYTVAAYIICDTDKLLLFVYITLKLVQYTRGATSRVLSVRSSSN